MAKYGLRIALRSLADAFFSRHFGEDGNCDMRKFLKPVSTKGASDGAKFRRGKTERERDRDR